MVSTPDLRSARADWRDATSPVSEDLEAPTLRTQRSALVIIGMQRTLLDSARGVDAEAGGRAGLVSVVNRLVAAASGSDVPVLLVRATRRRDGADDAFPAAWARTLSLVDGSPGHALVAGLEVPGDAYHITAKALSAFQHTPLDLVLTNLGIRNLVVVGGPVDSLLSSTVRQGAALGYEQFVVAPATYPSSSTLLAALRNRVATITAEDLVEAWVARRRENAAGSSAAGSSTAGAIPEALLVIDMQNDFVHRDGVMARLRHSRLRDDDRDRLVANSRDLVEAFRRQGKPVVFVRDVQTEHGLDTVLGPMMRRALPVPRSERFIVEGTWGADYLDQLRPREGDLEIIKRGNSAFAFTPLHRLFRNLRVRRCAVIGGATGGCISDTVREGVGLGYQFDVVGDCTFPADPAYLEVLRTLVDVRTTDDVKDRLAGGRGEHG